MGPLLLFKHVWIVVPCLFKSISLQPCVSNTFGLWSLVCLQASVSRPVFQTRLVCGSLSVYIISLQPFVSNTFDYGFFFVYPPAHTKMRVTREDYTSGQTSEPLSIFLEKEQLFGNWFDFGDCCEHFVDQVFQWLHLRHSGKGLRSIFTVRLSTVHVTQTIISRSTCRLLKHTSANGSESQATPCSY